MLTEFLGLTKRSLENPANPLDPWAGGGGTSDSGVSVNHGTALKIPAVWQALAMISGDVAKLPLNVFRRDDDTDRSVARSLPIWRAVRRKPNEEVGAVKFWRRYMNHAVLWGNAYAYIARNGAGEAMGLYNLLPDRTYPKRENGRLVYVTETTVNDKGGARLVTLPASDVLHVEGPTFNNLNGCDLVNVARDSFGLALAAEGFASEFFRNGAQAGGVLEIPPHYTAEAAANLDEGWFKKYSGPGNWFKTAILRDGAKFHRITIDAQAAQLIELRTEQVREIARWFNLAPSRLGLADSVSYNSKAEDNQAYLDTTLQIWLDLITEELWIKCLTEPQQEDHYFEHNTRTLLRMNAQARMENYATGLAWGIWSINEVRALENLNSREGGDVYYRPLNMEVTGPDAETDEQEADSIARTIQQVYLGVGRVITSDEAREIVNEVGAELPVPGPDFAMATAGRAEAVDTVDQSTLVAVRQLLFKLTERAKHKSKKPPQFCEWVDNGLIYHRKAFRETFGDNPAAESLCFDALLNSLNEALQQTQPDDLPAVVADICNRNEERAELIAEELNIGNATQQLIAP